MNYWKKRSNIKKKKKRKSNCSKTYQWKLKNGQLTMSVCLPLLHPLVLVCLIMLNENYFKMMVTSVGIQMGKLK